jgi:site-specific DNA-adenine methylase
MASKKLFSLLNYIGHKSKILDQILPLFPEKVDGTFWDLFCGSCVVGLSTEYEKIKFVDNNPYLIELFKHLNDPNFLETLEKMINKYGLTNSSIIPRSEYLKKNDVGFCTWHGKKIKNLHLDKLNKDGYNSLLSDFNNGVFTTPKDRGIAFMIATLYGRNSNVQINKSNNLVGGVGPLDFSKKARSKLLEHQSRISEKKHLDWINAEYSQIKVNSNDFVYLDPPYLASGFKYGNWNEEDERNLLRWIDALDCKWALSNTMASGEKKNLILFSWSRKYKVHLINKKYRRWGTKGSETGKKEKKKNVEVLITNY